MRVKPDIGLAGLAILVPILQAYSPPIVVPILALAAVTSLVLRRRDVLAWRSRPAKWLALWLAALTFYALSTSFWAVNARLSMVTGAMTLGVFLCALAMLNAAQSLDEEQRSRFGTVLLVGFLLGLANLQFNLETGGLVRTWLQQVLKPIIGPQRPLVMPVSFDTTMTLVALLAWPTLMVCARRFGWIGAVVLYALGFAVLRQGGSLSSIIAYAFGGAVFLAARLLPRVMALATGLGLALWVLVSPLVLRPGWTDALSGTVAEWASWRLNSFEHRRRIWAFVISRIHQRPWLGWGLGNSRAVPGAHTQISPGVELLPLHPHNAALQLWLELGSVGAVLGAAFFLLVVRSLYRALPDRTEFALALALLAAAVVNGMVSYNLWHAWWLAFIAVASCFAVAVTHRSERGGERGDQAEGPVDHASPDQLMV